MAEQFQNCLDIEAVPVSSGTMKLQLTNIFYLDARLWQ
jgi:hypothetical protein